WLLLVTCLAMNSTRFARRRRRLFAVFFAAVTTFCGAGFSLHQSGTTTADAAGARPSATAPAPAARPSRPASRGERPVTSPSAAAPSTAVPQPGTGSSTDAPAPATTLPQTGTTPAPVAPKPSSSAPAPKPAPAPAPQPAPVPAPAPVAAPAPAPVSTGEALPTSDLPGWDLVLSEGFDRPSALGSFARDYRGWAGYDGARDTSKNGQYNSAATTSVSGGILDKHLHSTGSGAQVMALTPPIASQTYGRYAVRFRMDQVPGYKVAWLLWPASDNWAEGEIDFPEGSVGGKAHGYSHDVNGNPSRNAWYMDSGMSMTSWRTAVIEWTPDSVTFAMDGKTWTTTDRSAIPTDPMRWVLQTETELSGGAPARGASGHVQIDWVAAWKRG
ncbi:glycoside hydrolase family 16 protein, partial [Modestobacter roseus]